MDNQTIDDGAPFVELINLVNGTGGTMHIVRRVKGNQHDDDIARTVTMEQQAVHQGIGAHAVEVQVASREAQGLLVCHRGLDVTTGPRPLARHPRVEGVAEVLVGGGGIIVDHLIRIQAAGSRSDHVYQEDEAGKGGPILDGYTQRSHIGRHHRHLIGGNCPVDAQDDPGDRRAAGRIGLSQESR